MMLFSLFRLVSKILSLFQAYRAKAQVRFALLLEIMLTKAGTLV
jgi:cytochrome c oxidase subunit IV